MHIQDKIGECATQFHHGIARHHGLTLERALLSDVNDLTDMHYSMQAECSINVRFPDRFGGRSDCHVLQGFHQGSDDSTDSTRHPELRSLVADQITSPNNSIFILFRDLRKNRAHRQAVGFCFSYPLQSKVHRTHCSAIV